LCLGYGTKLIPKSTHALSNGILYLKGGDLNEELIPYPKAKIYDLDGHFKEIFFETKKVVHLPL
jgi:16S rRNA (guanine527-N7)-methyltransferase